MSKFEEWEEPKKKESTDHAEQVRVMNGKDLPHLAWSDSSADLLAAAWHELKLRAEILDESPTMAEFVANREAKKKGLENGG